ncbi:hypothetical protein LY90DRAFT_516442 [Neocallimastix californiae]|uniref:Uncharacterized protein n=1 Tax=Neocallimastix californiae TaxID=1754190 RepID=A0A1Y2AG15_9FUNG|nr:hypothetical protein LY90DRAFT_516442 [Neocallimastix californiae]|eukprot:ORY20895.1 hypothetical protein LY90DRAFT_516442 [Neocallimastix californiae]
MNENSLNELSKDNFSEMSTKNIPIGNSNNNNNNNNIIIISSASISDVDDFSVKEVNNNETVIYNTGKIIRQNDFDDNNDTKRNWDLGKSDEVSIKKVSKPIIKKNNLFNTDKANLEKEETNDSYDSNEESKWDSSQCNQKLKPKVKAMKNNLFGEDTTNKMKNENKKEDLSEILSISLTESISEINYSNSEKEDILEEDTIEEEKEKKLMRKNAKKNRKAKGLYNKGSEKENENEISLSQTQSKRRTVSNKNKNKIRFEENDYDKTYDIINFLFELEDTQSELLPTLDLKTFSNDRKVSSARVIIKYRETLIKELKNIDKNFMAEADEERVEDIILRADKNKKKLTEYTSAECGNALMMLIRDVIITKNIYNKFILNNNCDLKEKHITSLFNDNQKELWNIIIGHFVNVIYLSDACIYDISNVIGWNLIPLSLLSLDDIGVSNDIKTLLLDIENNPKPLLHLKSLLFNYHPVIIAYLFQSQKSKHYKMSEILIIFYHGFSISLPNNKNKDKFNSGIEIEDCGYGFGDNNVLYFVNTILKYCLTTKQPIINIENVTDKAELKKNTTNVKDVLKTIFTMVLSLYESQKTSLGFKYICQQIVRRHSAEYMLEVVQIEIQYGKGVTTPQQIQQDNGQRQGLSIISEDVALTSNISNALTSAVFDSFANTKHIKEDVMFKRKELAIKQTINYLKNNNQILIKDIEAISSAKNIHFNNIFT